MTATARRAVTGAAWGAAAGAAGTCALHAVTYLDIALRGRPPSSLPERSVRQMAGRAGIEVPGDEQTREHRVSAIGALLGLLTGATVGAATGVARVTGVRLSAPGAALLTGGAAMVAANGSLVAAGLTDPRRWSAADWLSDLLPHLAYGAVTSTVLRRLLPG